MSFAATTGGISADHVRDLMVDVVEYHFGRINQLPDAIEWLTENGSCYLARRTQHLDRAVGLEPKTAPLESNTSNGMTEAFVRTNKRDYVKVNPIPDAPSLLGQLPDLFRHDNKVHPHKTPQGSSTVEFTNATLTT